VEKLHSTTEFASTAHPEYGVVAQHDFRRVDTHNTQSVEKLHSTIEFTSTAHPEYEVVAQHERLGPPTNEVCQHKLVKQGGPYVLCV